VQHGETGKTVGSPGIGKTVKKRDLGAKPKLRKYLGGIRLKNPKNRRKTGRSEGSAFLLSPKQAVQDLITDLK
jgi:hypothetical protein